MLEVDVCNGKYTVLQDETGNVRALLNKKEWRDCCGDGLILALAQEVDKLREEIKTSKHVIKILQGES